MAIDNKYGRIEIPGIPDDEPVFVLRAQDALAVPTICHYSSLVRELQRHEDKMLEALRLVLRKFSEWKSPRKLPD